MTTLRQESNQPLLPGRHGSPAGAYLASAAVVLQARLGKDLWARLDVHTKSCLVTSQIFHEMLEEVWTQREKDYERTGKRTGEIPAPMIDFSPVVLCVFKALEIEILTKARPMHRLAVRRI
jgi:hypothetical protein